MFSFRSFMVSGLIFRFLIHLEFCCCCFVHGVRRCSNFILLQVASVYPASLFKDYFFLIVYSCLVCCINSLIGESGHVISSFSYEISPTIVSVKVLLRIEYEACPAVTRTTLYPPTPTPANTPQAHPLRCKQRWTGTLLLPPPGSNTFCCQSSVRQSQLKHKV